MKKIHLSCSGLTGAVYAGHLLKGDKKWAEGKQDVTVPALVAVAEHTLKNGR